MNSFFFSSSHYIIIYLTLSSNRKVTKQLNLKHLTCHLAEFKIYVSHLWTKANTIFLGETFLTTETNEMLHIPVRRCFFLWDARAWSSLPLEMCSAEMAGCSAKVILYNKGLFNSDLLITIYTQINVTLFSAYFFPFSSLLNLNHLIVHLTSYFLYCQFSVS